MQVQQHEFIQFANNINAESVAQIENGIVRVSLTPQIEIDHSYKKKNMMTIKFTECGDQYIIPDRKELEFVVGFHLEGESSTFIKKYCEDWFKTTKDTSA